MARIHARKKGKAGSKRPLGRKKPTWMGYSPKEVEQLVIKLAKAGKPPAEIGLILRDSYGIPDVKAVTKTRINKILIDNNIKAPLPPDFLSLIKRHISMMKHVSANNHDSSSRYRLQLVESKIKRLEKYYKRKRVLPANWAYDKTKAKLLTG